MLFVHSEDVYLATVQPILQFIMCRLGVMFAGQMKMQKNIVNLVEQGLVCFVTFASFLLQVSWNSIPPFFKLACHMSYIHPTRSTLIFHFGSSLRPRKQGLLSAPDNNGDIIQES